MLLMSLSSRRQSKYQLQFEAGQTKTKQEVFEMQKSFPEEMEMSQHN